MIVAMDGDANIPMRSDCPVNFAVERLGDKWSLIIMRDILFWGKRTYGDLLNRDERIATNILASRLEYLEQQGLILRQPDGRDRRKEIFEPTERGIDLIPIIVEMVAWSETSGLACARTKRAARPDASDPQGCKYKK